MTVAGHKQCKRVFVLYLMLVIMFISLILLVICAFMISYTKKHKSKHSLPPVYPGALPIIGHTHLLLKDNKGLWKLLQSMADFCVKQGGVTCGQFGTDIYYGIADPDDALTVANNCLQKHYMYKIAQPWLGRGLLLASGAEWKHHRKVLSPAFSIPVINGFFDIFNSHSRMIVQDMEEHVGQGPYDHVRILRDVILRVSCITAFGDTTDKEVGFIRKYVDTVDEICHVLMARLNRVWYHSDFIYSLSPLRKKEQKLMKFLNAISDEVIQRKISEWKNEAKQNKTDLPDPDFRSFLDLALELTSDGSLSIEEIKQELNTAVAAAFETTSQQMVFMLTYLGSYPEVQEKMHKEIMEEIGPERDVEKEDLPKLVYTEAVIKECLRILPVAPLLARYVDNDVKLKNYTLRAGSYVFFMPHGLHRTAVWGEDPEAFKPERWLDKSKLPQFSNSFAAFSMGKRSCIGKTYAMFSMKVMLAHLVRQFRWTADHTKMEIFIDITISCDKGHELILERRVPDNNNKGGKISMNSPIADAFAGVYQLNTSDLLR